MPSEQIDELLKEIVDGDIRDHEEIMSRIKLIAITTPMSMNEVVALLANALQFEHISDGSGEVEMFMDYPRPEPFRIDYDSFINRQKRKHLKGWQK